MILRPKRCERSGVIVALVAMCLAVLLGFVALAIDIGMILVAKTQAQDVCDAAAICGTRTLDGTTTSNATQAVANAGVIWLANPILGNKLTVVTSPTFVAVPGNYVYTLPSTTNNPSTNSGTVPLFLPSFPPAAPYNLMQVTINPALNAYFGRLMGATTYNVSVTSMGAHRPHDATMVLDYSGSMNNESDLWCLEGDFGNTNVRRPNNADVIVPQWGHYDDTLTSSTNYNGAGNNDPLLYVATAAITADQAFSQSTPAISRIGRSNNTASALGVQAQAGTIPVSTTCDFFQNASGVGTIPAFNPATSTAVAVGLTTPPLTYPGVGSPVDGDVYLLTSDATNKRVAANWAEVTNGAGATTTTKPFGNPGVNPITNPPDPNTYGYNYFYSINQNQPRGATDTTSNKFVGWTQGPGYWGKTFFIWPPDPNPPNDAATPPVPGDWRKRFFLNAAGTAPLADDTKLFSTQTIYNGADSGSGIPVLRDPNGNYQINYKAILAWIKKNCLQTSVTDNKPFPPLLRGGRLSVYSRIPDDVPAAYYDHTLQNTNMTPNPVTQTESDQRFWKEYIDWTLGVYSDPQNNSLQRPGSPTCSMGPGFVFGNSIATKPPAASSQTADAVPNGVNPAMPAFVNPLESPTRPRHMMWFGAMTMIQFMADTGLLPGTSHDTSSFTAKQGIHAALYDIQYDHPNDLVSLIMYSRPKLANEPAAIANFDLAQVGLTGDYNVLNEALYYPPGSTNTTDIMIYSLNGDQTPRTHGDYTGNTATGYGLMLAYNQYSGNSTLKTTYPQYVQTTTTGNAYQYGGSGRYASSRLVILETDGMANVGHTATLVNSVTTNPSVNNSYYVVPLSNPLQDSDGVALGGAGNVCATNFANALCNQVTNGASPGFATPTKPVLLHCIGFGDVFEPVTNPGGNQPLAFTLCSQIAAIGGTGWPSAVNAFSDPNYYRLILGNELSRETKLENAIRTILNSDIPVSLVY